MRFEEIQDDTDDDEEWAKPLIQAAEAAEEDEWEWRIAMARARIEREEREKARPVVSAKSRAVTPPRVARPPVIIPPKG